MPQAATRTPTKPAGALALATAVAVAACSYRLSTATDEPGGLSLIQFTPAGPFRPGDGRQLDVSAWRIDAASAQAVITRNAQRNQPVVIDYEHQTLHKEKNGQPAPAAGWLRELRWVDGQGLFGAVALTARAREAIDAGEYLYFSPVFEYSKVDGTVLSIRMGALTNDPGIYGMQPLSLLAAATAAFLPSPVLQQEPTVNPLLKALLASLGLPESTTEDAAVAALTALGPLRPLQDRATAACTALSLPADASADSVIAACTSLRTTAATAAPDPAKYVPVAVVDELRTNIAALTSRQLQGDIEAAVGTALADGRLLPAQEAWARDLGKTNMAALTSYLVTAQPIAALSSTQTNGKPPVGIAAMGAQLSPEQLAVCSAMGMTVEQFKAGAAAA